MDPYSQPQPAMGSVASGSQVYPASAYLPAATVAAGPAGSQPVPPFPVNPAQLSAQQQLVYQQAQKYHQQQQQQQQSQLQQFWAERGAEIELTTDFKNHTLPLARIKKIMKADEDVRMIAAEAPVIFAKACEMFILELTLRSWMHTGENKRRTLQKNDIAAAIARTDIYDFLVDIVPRDDLKEEGIGLPTTELPPVGAPAEPYPYYYMPQQQAPGAAMVYGGPQQQAPGAAMVYGGPQQGHPKTYMWQETQGYQQGPPAEYQPYDKSG